MRRNRCVSDAFSIRRRTVPICPCLCPSVGRRLRVSAYTCVCLCGAETQRIEIMTDNWSTPCPSAVRPYGILRGSYRSRKWLWKQKWNEAPMGKDPNSLASRLCGQRSVVCSHRSQGQSPHPTPTTRKLYTLNTLVQFCACFRALENNPRSRLKHIFTVFFEITLFDGR